MNLTPTHYGAASTAITGLLIWALTRYVFKGSMPPEVAAAVAVIVPGIVGGAIGYFTRKEAKAPQPQAKLTTPTDGSHP